MILHINCFKGFVTEFRLSVSGPSQDVLFARHVLMSNPLFSAAILDKLWKTELQPRIDRIKNLAQGVPSDKQLMYLQRCLSALDELSFDLNYEQMTPPQPERKASDDIQLQHVLEELLSKRSCCKKTSGRATAKYILENIAVGTGDMKKAFSDVKFLNSNIELAREEYLKNLLSKRATPEFEQDYLNLREYLDSSALKIEDAALQQLIENRCRQVCIEKIQSLIGTKQLEKICYDSPLPPNKYLTSLIDHTIQLAISFQLEQFGDFHSIFETYRELKPKMPKSLSIQDRQSLGYVVSMENLRCDLGVINNFPISVWNILYADSSALPIVDVATYFRNSELIAERLAIDAEGAMKYFGTTNVFSISCDSIQKIINSYQKHMETYDLLELWDYFKDYTEQIYYSILLINLHRIVRDIKPRLLERTRFFVERLADDNSG